MENDNDEVWVSEYGMDCFGVGALGEEEGGTIPNHELPGKWWPLYIDDKQVGWLQLKLDRYTTYAAVKALPGHTIEVKTEGIAANE